MTTAPVQTCKRCLYTTNHPLGLVLDAEGICSGCRIHEEKDTLDWPERWDRLERIVKPYRSRDSRNYDCVVPVTGASDSFFIVHLVKERLGLKPLLVTYNRHYNTPLGIKNLSQLRRRFDCDILIQTVNPSSVKKIIRTTLRERASLQWHVLAGQTVFPVQVAVTHQVPLIIWGAHQGTEQVGMFSHLHEVEMTRRYRKDHDLMGCEADDLVSIHDSLNEGDIWQYRYPDEAKLECNGVRGIYLGNYVRWDPVAQHLLMCKIAGYQSAVMDRTFDVYDHVDDVHYMNTHDLIKQYKHGFGKVTDHACREIRHGRLTRDQAKNMINFYEHRSICYRSILESWLGLHPSGLDYIFNSILMRKKSDDFKRSISRLTHPAHNDLELEANMNNYFSANASLFSEESPRPILIGKGFP